MPTYEYRCEDCGELTEAMQRIADPPLTECPRCGGRLRKQISAPAFQFKGSGWYVTDYARKGGAAKEAGGDGEGKPAKGGEGGEGGEGKAAAGAESSGTGGGSSEKASETKPPKAAGGSAD